MNNDINEKIVHAAPVPPFVRFVASAVPMVFDNSLSYYEALCALWKWLQDDVINVINNNASVTEDYIEFDKETREMMETLKTYVDTYFDNLDVQEEINNKLDAMAEAGTLQEIITEYIQSNVAWTFDTVADMKQATNLVNGSYARTLGFHTLNDSGGATYYITDSGTANEMDVIAVGDLYANLVVDSEMDIKQYGAKLDGTDDSNVLSTALVSAVEKLNISGDIELDNQITISGSNKYLKFYGSVDTTLTTCVIVLDGAENITIDGATFDFENALACNCVYVKESEANIVNCTFKNIKNATAEEERDIVSVYEGSKCNVSNCYFENIKITGNGTIGDNSGTGRCILLKSDDTTKSAIVNIDNVSFKDCWNIDSEGNLIIEDFDAIHVMQSFTGQANISNVYFNNGGKRLFKIQGDNVNISNVEVDNSDDYTSNSVIAVMGNDNTNISNVRTTSGDTNTVLNLRRCANVNINNVCGTMKDKAEPFSTTAGLIVITGGNNINISNCNLKGGAYTFRVWESTSNVYITNCNFESPHSIGQMTCRSEASATASGINISDINFINCSFKTNATLNAHALSILPANDGTISNVKFAYCKFVYTANTYAYGLARMNGNNSVLDNCVFISNASSNNILANSAGDLSVIRSLITNNSAGVILISGSAKLDLDHCSTNNNISLSGTSCRLISEYSDHGTISYTSSATSAQVTQLSYS